MVVAQNQTIYMGLWSPWADVSCFECLPEDRRPQVREQMIDKQYDKWLAPLTSDDKDECHLEELTTCQTCDKRIWMEHRADVAILHNLKRYLSEKGINCEMQQTGGMCVSLLVKPFEDSACLHIFDVGEYRGCFAIALAKNDDDPDMVDLQVTIFSMHEAFELIRALQVMRKTI